MITLPGSEFFTLRPIGKGIYAAIAKEGSPAYSNVGVVDTGDHIIVFDTFNTFRAAVDLRRAIDIVTKRLPNFVVISHAHTDHWKGNQAFADHAIIMASRQTTDAMVEWAKEYKTRHRNPGVFKAKIREIESRLSQAEDPRLQADLSWSLEVVKHEYRNLQEISIQLPNQSFESKLDIYGTDALVKIRTLGVGHTANDTILLLPEDRIAFIGDLGSFQSHPNLIGSHPEQWVGVLDELARYKIRVIVPGHGPVGTKTDLQALKAYILHLEATVAAVVSSGGSEDDAASQPLPDFASNWAGIDRYENSMRYLYQWQTSKENFDASNVNISRILKSQAESAGYILDGVDIDVSEPDQSNHPSQEK